MARTTGPIIATAAITVGNSTILNKDPMNWRIPVAAAIAAGFLALAERASAPLATGIAYISLLTVLFVRVNPAKPAPVENFLSWWNAA